MTLQRSSALGIPESVQAQNDEDDKVGQPPPPLELIADLLDRHLHITQHQLVITFNLSPAEHVHFRTVLGYASPRLPVACARVRQNNRAEHSGGHRQNPLKSDHYTPAALFRYIDRERPTMLIDEADNADLFNDGRLRAVLNGGTERRGGSLRVAGAFRFCPLAVAAIGICRVPFCIAPSLSPWNGHRRTHQAFGAVRPPYHSGQQDHCDIVYQQVFCWKPKLNRNPALPKGCGTGGSKLAVR